MGILSFSISLSRQDSLARAIITDLLILGLFLLVLTYAHILPIPLYQLDPMKALLLVTIIYSSRGNAMLMAIFLPLLSFVSTGHPVAPKFLLISLELAIFTSILTQQKDTGKINLLLGAVLLSKLGYYLLKASLIGLGWLEQSLFSTGIIPQLTAVVVLISIYLLLNTLKDKGSRNSRSRSTS